MKYAIAGAAITGAMLMGSAIGSLLKDALGTAGSVGVWIVLTAIAYAAIRGMRGQG